MKWALKIGGKLLLSQLPVSYAAWRKLGLFRHGAMDSHDYARKIFRLHKERAFGPGSLAGKTILELGPGDSAASMLVGHAHGAERVILVDARPFATREMEFYRALAAGLRDEGLLPDGLPQVRTFEDMAAQCGGRYLTQGVDSFAQIETGSVDYIWSHSVLEHVPKGDFHRLIREFRRVLKPDGVMSHNIDFQDHLDHSLHNLRFPERVWESRLFHGAGFYTNRIRPSAMHGLVRSEQFDVLQEGFGRWPSLPLPRESLHSSFALLPEDDLLIRTSHLLARPGAAGAAA